MKRFKKILMLITVLCLSVSVISGCGPGKATTKDTKKEKQENVIKKEKQEKVKTKAKETKTETEEEEEEEIFETATPITPFYAYFEDYPQNKVPSLLDNGNGGIAMLSGDAASEKHVCIDTKEKALSYLAKAKKHGCKHIVYIIPSEPGTTRGPMYSIEEVTEGYENGTWTFANAQADYEVQHAESEKTTQEEYGYKPGSISGNKYESKFLGFGIEFPSDWTIIATPESSDKEMFTEISARNSNNETLLITIMKDTESTKDFDETVHLVSFKQGFEKKLANEYESSSVTYSEIKTGASIYKGLKMRATKADKSTYMTFFVIDCYDCSATIILSSDIDDDFSDILDTFFYAH